MNHARDKVFSEYVKPTASICAREKGIAFATYKYRDRDNIFRPCESMLKEPVATALSKKNCCARDKVFRLREMAAKEAECTALSTKFGRVRETCFTPASFVSSSNFSNLLSNVSNFALARRVIAPASYKFFFWISQDKHSISLLFIYVYIFHYSFTSPFLIDSKKGEKYLVIYTNVLSS